MLFRDRIDAGRQLAARLREYANRPDVLVLGLPRGGVPVAYEVARALNAPLDVFLVRKLGLPGREELAMGAIATGGGPRRDRWVGAAETCAALQTEADEVVCAGMPEPFFAVGQWYDDFSQTTDEEVRDLLAQSAQTSAPARR